MAELTAREQELVALGAAIGSNCVPCVEYHIPAARKAGLNDVQIAEACQLADRIKQVPARKVYETAAKLASRSCGTDQVCAAGQVPDGNQPGGCGADSSKASTCCGCA